MKLEYEFIKLVEAHYKNDDKLFNNMCLSVIRHFESEGSSAAADEIKSFITTGHAIERDSAPLTIEQTNKPIEKKNDSRKESIVNENINKEQDLKEIEEIKEVKKSKEETISKKTEADKDNGIAEKPKRHRRTKAEMEASKKLEKGNLSRQSTTINDKKDVNPKQLSLDDFFEAEEEIL